MLRILTAIALACALTACGGDSPVSEIAMNGIRNDDAAAALENARSDSARYRAILEASVSNCQEGVDSDGPVTVCDVCVITLRDGVREDGAGVFTVLEASQSSFNTKFWRGISYDQRYTRPANDGAGVWVTSGYETGRVEGWVVEVPGSLAGRLGFQQERQRRAIFTDGGASVSVSSALRSSAQLRADVLAAVGSCAGGPRVTEARPVEAVSSFTPVYEIIAETQTRLTAQEYLDLAMSVAGEIDGNDFDIQQGNANQIVVRANANVDPVALRQALAQRGLIILSQQTLEQ